MEVVIVGDRTGFPPGSAAANYVELMAEGLRAAGAGADVLPPAALPGRPRAGDAALRRMVRGRASRYGADVLIYYGHSPAALLRLRGLARELGAVFVLHLVEWPTAHPHTSARARLLARAFCTLAYRAPDAVIVISHWLQERAPDGLPVFRLPILARPGGPDELGPAVDASPRRAVLCADLDGYRHDALLAIEALRHAAVPDLELVLVGRASEASHEAITQAAAEAGVGDRVSVRTDFVPDDELRALYREAAALLAPMHDDDRSKARFPSKLAEYLLSGTPVVSNTVGEVAHYLRDGQTAYLAPPADPAALGEALRRAATSPGRGAVGRFGRAVAIEQFDARAQGRRLAHFLAGLTSRVSREIPRG